MITKSDFILLLEAPLHLWAKKHDALEIIALSRHQEFLIEQGYRIEKLAKDYLNEKVKKENKNIEISFEKTITNQTYLTRIDGILTNSENRTHDLVEIKSSTSVRKEDLNDLAFSYMVCKDIFEVKSLFLIHLNKEYIFTGKLEIEKLLVMENITQEVMKVADQVEKSSVEALRIAEQDTPNGIVGCFKPNSCPCPQLCHPNLPEYPIYDIPRLGKGKIYDLKKQGILSITELTENYPLSDTQRRQVNAVKRGNSKVNKEAITEEFENLEYPLYFLDYETGNPGIPTLIGFKPYQHIVFQFSLHKIERQGGELSHMDYLGIGNNHPELGLIRHLAEVIGDHGSILVWNLSFEATRNREMAIRHPKYSEMLLQMNERMYDLMDIFRKGYFVHPDFHGSYSIKKVLPVLVPNQQDPYAEQGITSGDEAMVSWFEINSGKLPLEEIELRKQALLDYCKLDTLAMVNIWRFLSNLLV